MAVTIRAALDMDGPLEAFRALEAAGADPRSLMQEIGAGLVAAVSQRFEREEDPDGRAWTPNRRGGMTLTDTGLLANSFSALATSTYVEIGTAVPYAGVHQEGAVIEAKAGGHLRFQHEGGWATVRSVTIPARPFLGIGPAEIAAVDDVLVAWTDRLFGG
jgi:phage virion morphogenesis protein